MAYAPLTTVAVGNAVKASQQNLAKTNLADHETRLLALEGSIGLQVLTADPASPDDDTWWVVRDGGTPQSVALKVRISGVTYAVAEITI